MDADGGGGRGGGLAMARAVLTAGEWLLSVASAIGIGLLLAFLCVPDHETAAAAAAAVAGNVRSFAKRAMPYAVSLWSCWCLSSIMMPAVVARVRPRFATFAPDRYVIAVKVTLQVAALVAKYYLTAVKSTAARIALFVGHQALTTVTEAVAYTGATAPTPATTAQAVFLLLWLTMLILAAPDDAYQKISLPYGLSWMTCSLAIGLTAVLSYHWYKDAAVTDATPVFYAVLLVLMIPVQLLCLCLSYFSNGQQILRNIVHEHEYNSMADALEMYFTVDSIVRRVIAYQYWRSNII